MSPKTGIGVMLEPETKQELIELAQASGMPTGMFTRNIIKQYLVESRAKREWSS